MKNYEKPVVMVNEGLAEGVYAASGCWSTTRSDVENKGNGWFYAYITVSHADVAHGNYAEMTVEFSEPVSVRFANYSQLTTGTSNVHTFSRNEPINAGQCNWQITIEGDAESGDASNLTVKRVTVVDSGN